MNNGQIGAVHVSVQIIDSILERLATDKDMPASVRTACVQSQGGLARILNATIEEAKKAA